MTYIVAILTEAQHLHLRQALLRYEDTGFHLQEDCGRREESNVRRLHGSTLDEVFNAKRVHRKKKGEIG